MITFPTRFDEIHQHQTKTGEIRYTRNYIDGAVIFVSYISRGVISIDHLIEKNYPFETIEKYVQELAWRELQQIWIHKKILKMDLKSQQEKVENHEIPEAILE